MSNLKKKMSQKENLTQGCCVLIRNKSRMDRYTCTVRNAGSNHKLMRLSERRKKPIITDIKKNHYKKMFTKQICHREMNFKIDKSSLSIRFIHRDDDYS